jgi:hypothetical protein
MCGAPTHVRFIPNNDIDCVFRHVRFGPIADIARVGVASEVMRLALLRLRIFMSNLRSAQRDQSYKLFEGDHQAAELRQCGSWFSIF